jgi:hypothetical protein
MTKPITNAERAMWAETGLREYATGKEGGEECYDDAELVLSDFLTDLMHYAQRQGIDFMRCIDRAKSHYEQEVSEEEEGAP